MKILTTCWSIGRDDGDDVAGGILGLLRDIVDIMTDLQLQSNPRKLKASNIRTGDFTFSLDDSRIFPKLSRICENSLWPSINPALISC